MVYAIQESLVCVFAAMVAAALAFIICAAMLLAGEALRHAYRALQEAAKLVKGATLKIIPGGPHGMFSTPKS